MSENIAQFPALDRAIHEPARLAILTVLSACERADFLFLQRATGLTKGNLSVQLSKLQEAGLIHIERTITRKKTQTMARLTSRGAEDLNKYWDTLQHIRVQKFS